MADRGADQAELAAAVGVTQGAISLIVRGETQRSRYLPAIADYLGVSLPWLEGREAEKRVPAVTQPSAASAAEQLDSVLVPLYDAPHALGAGAYFDEQASHELIPFKKSWLRSHISGRFDQVIMIPGRGDSMKPTIDDGDILLVDRAQIEVRDPDLIWAFGYGETGMVKRLRRLPKGGFLVQSDNAVVREFTATDDEIHIVGRVVSILRWQ